jgi:hypothetical protein
MRNGSGLSQTAMLQRNPVNRRTQARQNIVTNGREAVTAIAISVE